MNAAISPINAPLSAPEAGGLVILAIILWAVIAIVMIRAHYRDKTITRQIGQHNYTQFITARVSEHEHPEWDHFDEEAS